MGEQTPAPGEGQGQDFGQGTWSDSGFTSHGREDVRRLGGAARRRLFSEADQRRASVASRLEQLAGSLENNQSSGPEGRLLDSAARLARNASSAIRDRSSEELLDDLRQGFRNRPGAFLAGCLALGFIGGRLLRS